MRNNNIFQTQIENFENSPPAIMKIKDNSKRQLERGKGKSFI